MYALLVETICNQEQSTGRAGQARKVIIQASYVWWIYILQRSEIDEVYVFERLCFLMKICSAKKLLHAAI